MLLTIILAVLLFCHLFFVIGVVKKNYAVMDIGWGIGFIMIALIAYFHYPISPRNALSLVLVTIWGLRLAIYLIKRNSGKPEDPRYNQYRKEWGKNANLHAYFKVYLFQGLLMFIIATPFIFGMKQEVKAMTVINYLGLAVWIMGIGFESYADTYLSWYKKQPKFKGTICMSGPWRISRFPNYFGEISLWYGMYLLNFDLVTSWTIISPIVLSALIIKVTGIPFMEKKYKDNPEYQAYAARVPRLIPFTKP